MPEPTATNPQTGEKIVFRNGQWVPMTGATPAPTAPAAPPAVIPGVVSPIKQAQEQRAAQDQVIQLEQLDMAREDQNFQRQKFQFDQQNNVTGQRKTELEIQKLEREIAEKDPVAKQANTANSLLLAAGVDIARGVDPVSDLIKKSTSGRLQAGAANAWGAVTGDATSGMENIARLQTIVSDMTLQLTGGSLGTQISNADREFIMQRVGNLADPNVPADARLAAWEQVKARMANMTGVSAPAAQATPAGARRDEALPAWAGQYFDANGNPLGPEGGMAYDAEGNELGLVGRISDDTPAGVDPEVAERAAFSDRVHGEMGALGLAGHGLSLGLTDEAAGIGGAIAGALTGDFSLAENYAAARDAEQLRVDQARERLGWAGTAAEVLGGGALGRIGSGVSNGLSAARSIAARGAPINRAALQSQMLRGATAEGAVAGGVGGYGYGEGLEGSATNALLGAGLGGALGFAGQRVGNALANRSAPAPTNGAAVQQAADALDIPVIPAVTGGTTARRLTGGARQGFISDRPITRAVENMEEAGGRARDRAAANTGRALDAEDAGNVVRQAANVYSKRTSQIGGNLYDRADRMAGGVKLPLPRAVAAADKWLAELGQSVEGAEGTLYKSVKDLRDKMAGGEFTVKGIRQTRTELRERLQERGLRGSATDKVFGEILQEATEDLSDGLTAAGKQNAAGALRTANAFWKKRVETIDEVLEPILGKNAPRSGEQIVSAVEALMKPKTGNASRLRQLFDAMPDSERRSVAATVISRMGQPTAGAAQKDAGFSFNTFLTNWNNMSPRARAAMFPAETRKALDNLATVSQGVKEAGTAANTSNTASAIGVQAVISTPMIWLAEPLTLVAATGGQWTVGRLLASPRIARWVASAPTNPRARAGHVARLSGIARAEPALANEIGLLQRAVNDNLPQAGNLAASPDERPDQSQRR